MSEPTSAGAAGELVWETPETWSRVPLDYVSHAPIIYGILQPGPEQDVGVYYVRPTEIVGDTIQLDRLRKTTPEIAAKYHRATLVSGDVLLSIVGTVGKVAIVPPELAGANITQSSVRVRTNPSVSGPQFVSWVLRSPQLKAQFRTHLLGTGVPRLNVAHVRDLEFPLPPLNEQRRIVDKIEALTARSRRAKEALDAVPPLLDKLRQSILAAAFRGDLTKDWRANNPNVEPASVLLERIRQERRRRWEKTTLAALKFKGKPPKDDTWKSKYQEPGLGEHIPWALPHSWVWAPTALVGEVQLGRRRAPEYRDGRPNRRYLRVANVKDGRIDFGDLEIMGFSDEELRVFRLEPGDVLISEGQSLDRIGQCAQFPGHEDELCFQSTLHRWRARRPGPSSGYAALAFRGHARNAVFRRYASITTNIAHLTLAKLKVVPFPLAPSEEQEEIERLLGSALSWCDTIEASCERSSMELAEVDAAILSKAFRGELVPQDPNDEPASVLLERIRAEREAQSTQSKTSKKRTTKKRKAR